MPRDLKRVKEYIELGFDKEKAIEMVDEEGAVEPVETNNAKGEENKGEMNQGLKPLTVDEVKQIIAEEKQKENLKNTESNKVEEPKLEDAFKKILG